MFKPEEGRFPYRGHRQRITEDAIIHKTTQSGQIITFKVPKIGNGFTAIYVRYNFRDKTSTETDLGTGEEFISEILLRNNNHEISKYPFSTTFDVLNELIGENMYAKSQKNQVVPILLGKVIDKNFDWFYPYFGDENSYELVVKLQSGTLNASNRILDLSLSVTYDTTNYGDPTVIDLLDYSNNVQKSDLAEIFKQHEKGCGFSIYGIKGYIPYFIASEISSHDKVVGAPLSFGMISSIFVIKTSADDKAVYGGYFSVNVDGRRVFYVEEHYSSPVNIGKLRNPLNRRRGDGKAIMYEFTSKFDVTNTSVTVEVPIKKAELVTNPGTVVEDPMAMIIATVNYRFFNDNKIIDRMPPCTEKCCKLNNSWRMLVNQSKISPQLFMKNAMNCTGEKNGCKCSICRAKLDNRIDSYELSLY